MTNRETIYPPEQNERRVQSSCNSRTTHPTPKESRAARRTHYKKLVELRADPQYIAELEKLRLHEAMKCTVPAPLIVYARHDNLRKEYTWRLTPDKPKRQGIAPGDRVLVWTCNGYAQVTVTRIEEAKDGAIQPTARVKRKLHRQQPATKVTGILVP